MTTPEPKKLEACPCGKKAAWWETTDGEWLAVCSGKDCFQIGPFETKEKAAQAWNKRSCAPKDAEVALWRSMSSAPKDGSEFLIRYPKQGNVLSLCRWGSVHELWLNKAEAIFPESQGCEWIEVRIAARVLPGGTTSTA